MNNTMNSSSSVEGAGAEPTPAVISGGSPPGLTRGAERTEVPENCILYDWLTFSSPFIELADVQFFLGLDGQSGWVYDLPSRYHYAHRAQLNGVHIHYTPFDVTDKKYNSGCCVEFSGSGCRFFETVSHMDMQALCDQVVARGFNVSRVDIAYDDFSGLIDIEKMAEQASRFEFTSRLQAREVINSSKISESETSGISITHGSRSSHIFIRCYDKKYERSRLDLQHWVRLEIMLRDVNASGFLTATGSIGEKWSGVLNNYLQYRDRADDSNKRRWKISQWWLDLLSSAERLRLAVRKDEEYNVSKFRDFVYHHMKKTFLTALALDGPVFVLSMLSGSMASMDTLSIKQQEIIRRFSSCDRDQLQRFIDFCQQFYSELSDKEKSLFEDINNDSDLQEQRLNAENFLREKYGDFHS